MGVSLRAYGQLLARYLKHQWSRFALLVMLVCSSIGLVESLQNIGATVERLQELFDQKSTIVDGPSVAIPAGRPLALEFDSVSFSYTEGKPVLKNVSFQLPAGRVLGLLMEKGLIEERGRLDIPGRPILYGTTKRFLACTGLSDVNELRMRWREGLEEGELF